MSSDLAEQITRVQDEIDDLKHRWPAHSLKPALLRQLEELEDQLAELKNQAGQEGSDS